MDFKDFFSRRTNIVFVLILVILIFFVVNYLWGLSQVPRWNEEVPSDLEIKYEYSIFGEHSFIEVNADGLIKKGLEDPEKNKVYIEREGYLEEKDIKEMVSEFYKKNFFMLSKEYHDSFLYFINQESSKLEVLSISFNGKTYSVKDYGSSGPQNLKELIKYISDKASEQPEKIYSCTTANECNMLICYRENGVAECIENKCTCHQPAIAMP